MSITVTRLPNRFYPDPKRVITRFLCHEDDNTKRSLIQKVLNAPPLEIESTINHVLREYSKRHRNITKIFENHFNQVQDVLKDLDINPQALTYKTKLLIGSFFTCEYSIESAAFFNPSIIEDPDQSNLEGGQKRVIISFRATGEGHISSVVFRNGIIDKNNQLIIDEPGTLVDVPEHIKRHVYEKKSFIQKLDEMDVHRRILDMVMDKVGETFIYGELQAAIVETLDHEKTDDLDQYNIQAVNWVADSHYEVSFSLDTAISERVLFPVSYTESNGIEDARFVRFVDDDGSVIYYATYTAYDGRCILPKLLETKDFYHFRILPLHGKGAHNKNLALFPRKISGRYAMLARIDGINSYIMFSDNINLWQKAQILQEPSHPWEYTKIGNCGSPIETEKGWLVITHGVGPMRTYTLGAILLDHDNPTQVIGSLKEPLLMPNDEEREGYVPNVVYSCGAILNNGSIIIPYGLSDSASGFVSVSLDDLFNHLR